MARARKYKICWNTFQTRPEQVEAILEKEGIRIIERGIQPCSILNQEGKYTVVEATKQEIHKLFTRYPIWMLLKNIDMIVVIGVGRNYAGGNYAVR